MNDPNDLGPTFAVEMQRVVGVLDFPSPDVVARFRELLNGEVMNFTQAETERIRREAHTAAQAQLLAKYHQALAKALARHQDIAIVAVPYKNRGLDTDTSDVADDLGEVHQAVVEFMPEAARRVVNRMKENQAGQRNQTKKENRDDKHNLLWR